MLKFSNGHVGEVIVFLDFLRDLNASPHPDASNLVVSFLSIDTMGRESVFSEGVQFLEEERGAIASFEKDLALRGEFLVLHEPEGVAVRVVLIPEVSEDTNLVGGVKELFFEFVEDHSGGGEEVEGVGSLLLGLLLIIVGLGGFLLLFLGLSLLGLFLLLNLDGLERDLAEESSAVGGDDLGGTGEVEEPSSEVGVQFLSLVFNKDQLEVESGVVEESDIGDGHIGADQVGLALKVSVQSLEVTFNSDGGGVGVDLVVLVEAVKGVDEGLVLGGDLNTGELGPGSDLSLLPSVGTEHLGLAGLSQVLDDGVGLGDDSLRGH